MAVTNKPVVLAAWSELAADLTTVRALQNMSGSAIELAVAGSLPAANALGLVLMPGETITAERIQADIGASGALYGKSINASGNVRVST